MALAGPAQDERKDSRPIHANRPRARARVYAIREFGLASIDAPEFDHALPRRAFPPLCERPLRRIASNVISQQHQRSFVCFPFPTPRSPVVPLPSSYSTYYSLPLYFGRDPDESVCQQQ